MKRRRWFLIISFWRSFAFSLLWISVQLTDIRKEMLTERLKVCAYKTCVQHHLYISIDLHWIPFLFICLVHHSFVFVFALPFRYFSVPFFIFRWDTTRMNVKIGIILLKSVSIESNMNISSVTELNSTQKYQWTLLFDSNSNILFSFYLRTFGSKRFQRLFFSISYANL